MNIKTLILNIFIILISSTVLSKVVRINDMPLGPYCDGIYRIYHENCKC